VTLCDYFVVMRITMRSQEFLKGIFTIGIGTIVRILPEYILSVESNLNVESKTKNVESSTEKCGVQNSIFTSRNQLF